MKKLLNEWKTFLNENLGLPNDVLKIEDNMAAIYEKYDKEHWEKIYFRFEDLLKSNPTFRRLGRGASRTAYAVGDDDFVIKIVNHYGEGVGFAKTPREMNQHEAKQQMHVEFPNLFPRAYYIAPDQSWYITQRVTGYDWNDGDVIMEEHFPRLKELMSFGDLRGYLSDWAEFAKADEEDRFFGNLGYPAGKNSTAGRSEVRQKTALKREPFLNDIVLASKKYPIGVDDMHGGNLGWVYEDGKKRLVFLDYILN